MPPLCRPSDLSQRSGPIPAPAMSAQGPAHWPPPPIAKLAIPASAVSGALAAFAGRRRRGAVALHARGLQRLALELDAGAGFAADRPALAAVGGYQQRQHRVGPLGQVVGGPARSTLPRQRVGLVLFVAPAARRLARHQAGARAAGKDRSSSGAWPGRRLVEDLFLSVPRSCRPAARRSPAHRDDRPHLVTFANRRQRDRVAERAAGRRPARPPPAPWRSITRRRGRATSPEAAKRSRRRRRAGRRHAAGSAPPSAA